MDSIPVLDLWNVVIEVLHSSNNVPPTQNISTPKNNRDHNSTRRPQRKQQRVKLGAGGGKSAKFWAPSPSSHPPSPSPSHLQAPTTNSTEEQIKRGLGKLQAQYSRHLVGERRWPKRWSVVKSKSFDHTRTFFSGQTPFVHFWRQRSCDKDDHQRKKSDDETRV